MLISWEGCTLDDPRLELFAKKVVPPDPGPPLDAGPAEETGSPQMVRRPVLCQMDLNKPDPMAEATARPAVQEACETGQRLLATADRAAD